MTTVLGKKATEKEWPEALLVAEGFLIGAAQARRLVTYKELNAAIRAVVGAEVGPQGWGNFLGELVGNSYERDGVMLSALVVRSAELTPGGGFKALALEKGWASEDASEPAIVEDMRAAVFKHFAVK